MKKFMLMLAGAAALVAGTSAQAAMKLWTIHDAVFSDGGTWSGSFEWDATTRTFGNYSWTVSGGDEVIFPGTTYTNANFVEAPSYGDFLYSSDHIHLYSFNTTAADPNVLFRSLYLTTQNALPNTGGTMQLDFTSGYAAGECDNCAPYRPLVSGYLTADLTPGGVPEPANWALMIGGIGMIGTSGRYARRKVSVAYA
jgi:hypothetical protein